MQCSLAVLPDATFRPSVAVVFCFALAAVPLFGFACLLPFLALSGCSLFWLCRVFSLFGSAGLLPFLVLSGCSLFSAWPVFSLFWPCRVFFLFWLCRVFSPFWLCGSSPFFRLGPSSPFLRLCPLPFFGFVRLFLFSGRALCVARGKFYSFVLFLHLAYTLFLLLSLFGLSFFARVLPRVFYYSSFFSV